MLKQRILTALVLLPLMLLMLLWANASIWAMFTGIMTLLALWEYSRLCQFTLKQQLVYTGGTAFFMFTAYCGDWQLPTFIWLAVLVFWLVLMPMWLMKKWTLHAVGVRSVATGWLMFLPFWYALTYLRPENESIAPLLSIMALVWVADIFAYFVGKSFGKHKLAPTISPKKSWEGAIGGLVAVWVYMLMVQHFSWLNLNSWWLLATVLTALSIGGDLLESWFKRTANVKDSSQLLPGHGGVFDRIDGLIVVVSVYAAIQIVFFQ